MDLDLAIWQFNPAAQYTLNAAKTAIAEWRGPGSQPTQGQIDSAWADYQNEDTRRLPDGTLPADADPTVVDLAPRQYHVVTTNATSTEIARTKVPSNSILEIQFYLFATKTDKTAAKRWRCEVTLSRADNGPTWWTNAIVDITAPRNAGAGTATWNRSGALSGNEFVLSVTGAASTTIQWSMLAKAIKYTL